MIFTLHRGSGTNCPIPDKTANDGANWNKPCRVSMAWNATSFKVSATTQQPSPVFVSPSTSQAIAGPAHLRPPRRARPVFQGAQKSATV
jgi:hypothetical protein